MVQRFSDIAFTPTVKKIQESYGSRKSYTWMEAKHPDRPVLGPRETAFISERDSLYMATVSETGWPYIQHRGGPKGFIRRLDQETIGFADFRGNRQYVTVGNLMTDDRVSLILLDYPNRERLKLFGHARLIGLEDKDTLSKLTIPDYRAVVERGILIKVEAFDWNCPQHITPRFAKEEIEAAMALSRH